MASEQSGLRWLEQQQVAMQDLLADWVALPSGSSNAAGLQQLAARLAVQFKQLTSDVTLLPCAGTKDILLQAKHNPQAPVQLLCVGHMDTVFGEQDRFTLKKLNEEMWQGPGVIDMKGGLVILYFALQALTRASFADKMGWQVLITPDEETGSLHSREQLKQCARTADCALVFEPAFNTRGTFVLGRGGSGKFTITAKGVSAHVGRAFDDGRNAILALGRLLYELNEMNDTPNLIVNAGMISGGKAANVVPDRAHALLDVRIESQSQGKWFRQQLARYCHVVERSTEVEFEVTGEFTRPVWTVSEQDKQLYAVLSDCAESLNLPYATYPSQGCSDANLLSDYGVPVIDTLGAIGEHLHTHEETIQLQSLTTRAQLAFTLFERLAQHGVPWQKDLAC